MFLKIGKISLIKEDIQFIQIDPVTSKKKRGRKLTVWVALSSASSGTVSIPYPQADDKFITQVYNDILNKLEHETIHEVVN